MKETMAYIEEHGFDHKMIHGNLIVEIWHFDSTGTYTMWEHIESLEELKARVGDED